MYTRKANKGFAGKIINFKEEIRMKNKMKMVFGAKNLEDLKKKMKKETTTSELTNYRIRKVIEITEIEYNLLTSNLQEESYIVKSNRDILKPTPENENKLNCILVKSKERNEAILISAFRYDSPEITSYVENIFPEYELFL